MKDIIYGDDFGIDNKAVSQYVKEHKQVWKELRITRECYSDEESLNENDYFNKDDDSDD